MFWRGLAIVFSALAVGACLLASSGLAANTTTRPITAVGGRFFDASGPSGLNFVVQTSASARRVKVTKGDDGFQFVCGTGSGLERGDQPAPDAPARSANISRDGAFSVVLPVKGDHPIRLAGQFVTTTSISGTVTWDATGEGVRGCKVSDRWSARVRPLNDYFAGTTSTGATVTFAVAVSAGPVMSEFSVGGVDATCPQTPREPPPTTPTMISISDGYVGAVHDGRFSAMTEDSNGIEFGVKGTLTASSASGVVDETDRTGCGYGNTSWTAQFVRRGV